jgi:hypothetical protein
MNSGLLIKMINETFLRLEEEEVVGYFEDITANFVCKVSEKNCE